MSNIRIELNNAIKDLIEHSNIDNKTLVIHSSFAKLLPPNNFSKWDALYIIDNLTKKGFTIALPSFTFSFCKSKFYSEQNSISETGLYADWVFHNFSGAIRTKDPLYSFVIIGPQLKVFNSLNPKSCWGEGSIFEYFELVNAKILTLGCGFESVTQFHRYEEILKVPYRKYKKFSGIADFSTSKKEVEVNMFVRDLFLDPKNNMNLISNKMKETKTFHKVNLFRGEGKVIEIKDLLEVTKKELNKNQFVLLENEKDVKLKLSQLKEKNNQKNLKVAILGFNNNEIISKQLKNHFEKYIPERNFDIYIPQYDQFIQDIINKNSSLNKLNTFLRIFLVNFNDIKNLKNEVQIDQFISEYIGLILDIHNRHKGWTFVNLFHNNNDELSYENTQRNIYFINKINNYLIEKFIDYKSIILIDPVTVISKQNANINNPSLWYLGRIPYSNEFTSAITYEWTKSVISILNKQIRLIILDLDNTIWGGVLGEDGITGIQIGGDYPGNAFYDFQKEIINLRSRGIAIAISSKNDERLVNNAFESLKEMPLKMDMFSAKSIGWHEKALGIAEITNKLNLGIYSTLFIDDNLAEIQKVKNQFPEIKVLHLPKDPTNYVNYLRDFPYLKTLYTSKEDLNRIKSFKTLSNIKDLSKNKVDLNKYLTGLEIKIFLSRLNSSNLNRATQLCQKTNQFNTTTIRYTENELLELSKTGSQVILIGHKTQDTDYENIGLMVINENVKELRANIVLYLLSCRVLGRGFEDCCIKLISNYYLKKGFKTLNAELIKNENNKPVHNLFKEVGFKKKLNTKWELLLLKEFEPPKHLKIYNKL